MVKVKTLFLTCRKKPALYHAVFYDEGESLSGIEIEIISHGRFFGEEIEKIFISTNELKQIITILRDSPILKQFDWGEDWT